MFEWFSSLQRLFGQESYAQRDYTKPGRSGRRNTQWKSGSNGGGDIIIDPTAGHGCHDGGADGGSDGGGCGGCGS